MLDLSRDSRLKTGYAIGSPVLPIITGSSLLAARLSKALFEAGINAPPIIYPAVEERVARLRFFISSAHSEEQIRFTIDEVARQIRLLTNSPLTIAKD